MLHAAGLPDRFWSFACQAAVYLNNRLPSKATSGTTPYQLWHGKRPHIGHLRTFGCLAYALVEAPGKLEDRAARCTFVGYSADSSRTYLLWDNQRHKLTHSGQVHFIESILGWNYNPRATVTAGEATAGEAAAGEEQISRALTNRASDSQQAAAVPAVLMLPHDVAPIEDAQPAPDTEVSNIIIAPPPPASNDVASESPASSAPPAPQAARLNRAQQNQLRRLQDNLSPAVHDLAPAAPVTDAMLQSDRPSLRAGPGRQHYYGSAHAAQASHRRRRRRATHIPAGHGQPASQ